MRKHNIILGASLVGLAMLGLGCTAKDEGIFGIGSQRLTPEAQSISEVEELTEANTVYTESLSEADARAIAKKTCIKGGDALGSGIRNDGTKTWWFDANLNAAKEGCNPACVVSDSTRQAEINWRCTGLVLPE